MAQERFHTAFQDRVVHIARVAKVVKGGRRFSFSALACVGDGISKVGFSIGKANEVSDAIEKASQKSKRKLIDVPIVNGTIPFPVVGKYGSSRVMMYPAPQGKGIIAGSSARIVFVICGITDIVCKIHGSRNHHNVVRATFHGLSQLQHIKDYASLRGLQPEDVLQVRVGSKSEKDHQSIIDNTKQARKDSDKEHLADKEPSADKKPSADKEHSILAKLSDDQPQKDQDDHVSVSDLDSLSQDSKASSDSYKSQSAESDPVLKEADISKSDESKDQSKLADNKKFDKSQLQTQPAQEDSDNKTH